jgi:hypothetical protein
MRHPLRPLILPFLFATASCATQTQIAAETKAWDDAKQATEAVFLDAAATDLRCPRARLTIAARLPSRYANAYELRFVIDGCSQRALYAGRCDVHDEGCTALLVSRTALDASPPADSR